MAYRDELGAIVRDDEQVGRALAKARFDARVTAIRQVVLAFAFGVSLTLFDDAEAKPFEPPPPALGYGWLDIVPRNHARTKTIVDGRAVYTAPILLQLKPGTHQLVLVDDDGIPRRHVAVIVEPGMTVSVKE